MDYESKNSYSVMVNVGTGKDDAGKVESDPQIDTSIWVTINVTDVDEQPIWAHNSLVNATRLDSAAWCHPHRGLAR